MVQSLLKPLLDLKSMRPSDVNGQNFNGSIPKLCLLSTYHKPDQRPFVLSWAASAATAQVARMAAIVKADYPEFWPETVRALTVHSARWTRSMEAHLRGRRRQAREGQIGSSIRLRRATP
jgi:hypothetical protein